MLSLQRLLSATHVQDAIPIQVVNGKEAGQIKSSNVMLLLKVFFHEVLPILAAAHRKSSFD